MKRKLESIIARLKRERPGIDPFEIIAAGRVWVGGARVDNPRANVRSDATLVVDEPRELRGTRKLRAAIEKLTPLIRVSTRRHSPPEPGAHRHDDTRISSIFSGCVALDVGASTGGFTQALLDAGAARVYAVDAGYGQLLGSLRLDPRVRNLERTNLAQLDRKNVPDVVDVLTMDLSYLSLHAAIAQLSNVTFADDASALLLVKPMFELALDHAPTDQESLEQAIDVAARGIAKSGWRMVASMRSAFLGANGAVEAFIWARRAA